MNSDIHGSANTGPTLSACLHRRAVAEAVGKGEK
jgi:hypothetical protein